MTALYDDPRYAYDAPAITFDGVLNYPSNSNGAGPWQDQFQFLCYDFLTATFLGTLPFAGVTWSQQLNGAGTFSGTLNMADPRVQAMDPALLTAPGRTMLMVDYGGSLVWGGWTLTARPFTRSTRILNYTASELESYFTRRIQATDYSSPPFSGITGPSNPMPIWGAAYTGTFPAETGWDPMLIACQVITDALGYLDAVPILNGNPAGGMQIKLNGTSLSAGLPTAYLASGTNTPQADYISINYPYTSFQTVDSIVSQLAGLGFGVGFDYGVDVAFSNGPGSAPMATINLNYPRRGRTFANNNVVVQVAGSARDYTVTPDASSSANTLYETGGSGAVVISQNLNPLEQGYAVLEQTVSRSQIQSANVIAILSALGEGDLYVYSYPMVTFSVKVPLFGNNPQFGQFTVGDDCRLLIDPDEMFPNGLDGEWRITGYQVDLPDEGDPTMTLTLSPPPVYPNGAYI